METPSLQLSSEQEAIRKLHRSIVGTSFFLVLILMLAMYLNIVRPPFSYILFAMIFIVDFAAECYSIWKYKMYWIGKTRFLEGSLARVVAIVYGFLSIVCLALAIYIIQVYYL